MNVLKTHAYRIDIYIINEWIYSLKENKLPPTINQEFPSVIYRMKIKGYAVSSSVTLCLERGIINHRCPTKRKNRKSTRHD